MARKHRPKDSKTWTPDSPLQVDWSAVLEKKGQTAGITEHVEHVDNPLHPKGGGPNHPMSPASHKSHIRQKKG